MFQAPCSRFFSLDSRQWCHLQAASAGPQACDRERAMLNRSEFWCQTYIDFYCKSNHWAFRKCYNLINLRDFFWQFAERGIFHSSNIKSVSLSNPIYHCTEIKGDTVPGEKLVSSYSLNQITLKVVYWFISNMILTHILWCTCCWAITPEDAEPPEVWVPTCCTLQCHPVWQGSALPTRARVAVLQGDFWHSETSAGTSAFF